MVRLTIVPGDVILTIIDGLIFIFELIGAGLISVCPGMPVGLESIGTDLALAVIGLMISVWSVGLVNDDACKCLDV